MSESRTQMEQDHQSKSVNLFQDDTDSESFEKTQILPLGNGVTPIDAIGYLSHTVRGTLRDNRTEKFFSKTAILSEIVAVSLIPSIG